MTNHQQETRQEFASTVSVAEADIDLAVACLQIAVEEYGALDTDAYIARLDSLASRARDHMSKTDEPFEVIHGINTVLFDEEGFGGNRQDYYDHRNSYLCDVMDRRLGNPILLCILYNELAGRIAGQFRPIGLPGHFVLQPESDDDSLFVDPFDRGGLLTKSECERLVTRITGREKKLKTYFNPLGKKSILARVLNNLKLMYLKEQNTEKALAAAERIEMVAPNAWENIGDIARLQTDMGNYSEAMESLTRYLQLAPLGRDTSSAQAALEAIKEGIPPPSGIGD
ncbi:MAG: tetratricopeptide repeat protein [Chloroflexi bacterium]|nr:tetratricopeptide repeat protein [Chloroflexota bacterium]